MVFWLYTYNLQLWSFDGEISGRMRKLNGEPMATILALVHSEDLIDTHSKRSVVIVSKTVVLTFSADPNSFYKST